MKHRNGRIRELFRIVEFPFVGDILLYLVHLPLSKPLNVRSRHALTYLFHACRGSVVNRFYMFLLAIFELSFLVLSLFVSANAWAFRYCIFANTFASVVNRF